jgi:hypothetical protein
MEKRKALSIASFPVIASSSPPLSVNLIYSIFGGEEKRGRRRRGVRDRVIFTLIIIVGGADKTEGETVRQGWVLTRVTEYIEFET